MHDLYYGVGTKTQNMEIALTNFMEFTLGVLGWGICTNDDFGICTKRFFGFFSEEGICTKEILWNIRKMY